MRGRRGVILLATFVVVVIAAMTAGAVVQMTAVQRLGLAASGARAQSRALAWSGVLGVMTELETQREALLRGGEPELTREWTVYETDGGERGVVRLRLIGGRTARSEAALLDMNSATEAMLAGLGAVGEEGATRITAAREEALFGSIAEALSAADLLPNEAGSETGSGDVQTPALRDLVTVFSADPLVQAGVGPEGNRHAGEACVSVRGEWDEALRRSLERRFSPAVLDAVQPPPPEEEADAAAPASSADSSGSAAPRPQPPATMAEFIQRVQQAGLSPEALAEAMDTFTIEDAGYRFGRVDIMRAPEAVLRCIPGVDEIAAAAIVERRESLDEESRLSAAWLLTDGILTEEAFREAAAHVTTRTLQWRIIVEAGIEDASTEGALGEAAPLRNRASLEAVIDVAGERARVAYLRDVTLLESAAALARLADEEAPRSLAANLSSEAEDGLLDSGSDASRTDEAPEGANGLSPNGLNLDSGLRLNGLEGAGLEEAGASRSPAPPDEGANGPGSTEGKQGRGRIGRWRSR